MCATAAKRKTGDKQRRMVELAVSAEEAASLTEKRSSPQRREAVRLLAAEGRMSAAEVCYYTGVSMAVLRGLEKAGIVAFSEEEALRYDDTLLPMERCHRPSQEEFYILSHSFVE